MDRAEKELFRQKADKMDDIGGLYCCCPKDTKPLKINLRAYVAYIKTHKLSPENVNPEIIQMFSNEKEEKVLQAERYIEDDGTVTLSLQELDIVENAADESSARYVLGSALLEYAADYIREFELYSNAPNRKHHVPYVLQVLKIGNAEKLGEMIVVK